MTTQDRTAPGSALHRGALVLLVSVLAGLLVAGVTFPVIGGVGLLARSAADSFDQLPAELREEPLPQRTKILAADGSVLADIFLNENRILAPISQMPKHLLYAIVAIEDSRFYEHGGVDVRGLTRAVVRNSQAGTVTQGGSTITQQYVKNMLIVAADDKDGKRAAIERSTQRKIQEARYALALERLYTKRQILEKYLNISYFGNGVYGVGTAAQYYFGKRVSRLTLEEGALLAGLVQNPERYNPVRNPGAAKSRRDVVLRRIAEVGFMPAAVVEAAMAKPVPKIVPQQLQGIEDNKIAPAFVDYMRSYFLADHRFGASVGERATRLFQGGLTIRTSLDPKVQASAQKALDTTLPLPKDPAAAAVVVKPGTGHVTAMAVLNHGKSVKVNLATSRSFQPGSTFKTFTLAAAIEEGLPLRMRISSPARYRADPTKCDNPPDGYFRNAGDSEAGNFDLPTATWLSVNTYYLQLQNRVGLDKVAAMARRMGVQIDNVGRRECSLTLGARSVSPLEMAGAYATLAAQGRYCKPTPIVSVHARGREPIDIEPDCHQAIEPGVANTVTSVLRGVIDGTHPHRTGKGAALGRPAAGKTGTTNGPTAAWFAGYTPDYAAAVWMGHADRPAQNPLRNIHGRAIVYGGGFPASMWRAIMLTAHENLPVADFVAPPASSVLGTTITVPDLRGASVADAEAVLKDLGLNYVIDTRPVAAGPIPAGLVGAQRPGPGASVYKGTTIVLFLSDGRYPPPPPVVTPSPTPTAAPTSAAPTSSPSPTPSPTPKPCNGNPDKCATPTPTPTPSPTPSGGGAGGGGDG